MRELAVSRSTDTRATGKQTRANSLVALSAAAIIAVYAAGYARTTPAAARFPATAVAPRGAATPVADSSIPLTAISPTEAAALGGVGGPFRDGTYTGTGTSRHGNIVVTVTVQAGKIVAAEVTDCGTRYPCTLIAELPGQAIARQSAAVDAITGATDSTNAYRAAVHAALAQAR